jgi:hypothetical protein
MELREYFEKNGGIGVLSTADSKGRVDSAVYARPHVMEDGSLAFIMTDRLTHKNITSNPHAVYLFKEDGPGWKGKRLFLTRVREEQDSELLQSLRRRKYSPEEEAKMKPLFLVFFKLDRERPLVGG